MGTVLFGEFQAVKEATCAPHGGIMECRLAMR